MTLDHKHFRDLAETITPGKWLAPRATSILGRGIVAAPSGRMIGSIVDHENEPNNADFIAYAGTHATALAAALDENARLREALERIKALKANDFYSSDPDKSSHHIARQALEPRP